MAKEVFVVPGINQFRDHPHAIMADETLYTTPRVALDPNGDVVGKGDFAAQVEKVYRDMDTVLSAAGYSFEKASRLRIYTPNMEGNYTSLVSIRDRYLPDAIWTGTGVDCDLVNPDLLYQLEVMTGESKDAVISPHVSVDPNPRISSGRSRCAHATRVGHVYHVQGRVPWDLEGKTAGVGDITAQAKSSFGALDHIAQAIGATWDDVIKVTTCLKHAEDNASVEAVRSRYVKDGRFAATTFLSDLVVDEHLLEPEMIVATGSKEFFVSPDVYRQGGAAHAVRVSDTIYTSGMVALDRQGNLVGEGDIEAQTDQVLNNLGAVLNAAGASWDQVVKLDTYLARRQDHPEVVATREKTIRPSGVVASDVVTGWVDPRVLVQMECIAVA